jgi:hypothetical protein
VQSQRVGALRQFNPHRILCAFGVIVLLKLLAETADLDAYGRVCLRIKVRRTPEDLGGDLVLLQVCPGILNRISREIAQ